MKSAVLSFISGIMIIGAVSAALCNPGREFLTEEEIDAIQRNQAIAPRVKLYLRAASLRLSSAEARLNGQETTPGDPLEYHTPEDMLDEYYRIVDSVMLNLEDAAQKFPPDKAGVRKALKHLRNVMKKSIPELETLKKIAAEKKDTELLRLIRRAADISNGALQGAEEALEGKFSEY